MYPSVFLDVDGVLADFLSAAVKLHRLPISHDAIKVWNFHHAFGMTDGDLFGPMDESFWSSLGKYPEADEVIRQVETAFGRERIALCTVPCKTWGCSTGKMRWIEKHFPNYAGRTLLVEGKDFLSGPGKVLIDDAEHQISCWRNRDGFGILVPRPWNSGGKKNIVRHLKKEIKKYKEKLDGS
jgi:5'(3')-deoxyribonucleotidase